MPVHYGSKEFNFHTVSSPLSKINNFKLLFFFNKIITNRNKFY
jgi:hypothetical protein